MAPKTPSTTTQITKVELPKWVDSASQENYNLAKELGTDKFLQYKGDRVADLNGNIMAAINNAKTSFGSTQGNYSSANGILKNVNSLAAKLDPSSVKAGMLKDTDLSAYMNPYLAEVETNAINSLDRSRLASLNSNSSAASAAGAFGGSRHGIVDAVTNAETAINAGNLSAQLRKQGFDTATGLAMADLDRSLMADVSNSQNILDTFLAKTGAMNTSATGLMNSAAGSQDAKMKDLQALMQTGGLKQQYDQSVIDADRAKFDEKRNYDIENLNLRLSALGMSPYGKTESATKTQTGGSSGTDFGQLGMGLFSMLLGLSDDDSKTDKEKIGKVPGTDLDMYAWRYKNDPKTYPKVVGVMASDLEKKMPSAVHKLEGGKRIVDYGQVMGAIANG